MAVKKLERLQQEYDIELDTELVNRREQGESFRELQTFVNQEVVRAAVGATPVSPQSVLRVLTEDVTEQERLDIADRLDTYNISIDTIEADLVSHETVRTYLKEQLDVEYEPDPITEERVLRTVEWATARERDIVQGEIERLAKTRSDLSLGDGIQVRIDVSVECTRSGDSYGVAEFIDAGGCP